MLEDMKNNVSVIAKTTRRGVDLMKKLYNMSLLKVQGLQCNTAIHLGIVIIAVCMAICAVKVGRVAEVER